MKKFIILFFISVIMLAGCSISSKTETGYKGTVWGSTKNDIKKLEEDKNFLGDFGGNLEYTDFDLTNPLSTYGFAIGSAPIVKYEFENNRLNRITITVNNDSITYKSADSVFESMKEKYGDSVLNQRSNQYNKDQIMLKWAKFETESSDITLYISVDGVSLPEVSAEFVPKD